MSPEYEKAMKIITLLMNLVIYYDRDLGCVLHSDLGSNSCPSFLGMISTVVTVGRPLRVKTIKNFTLKFVSFFTVPMVIPFFSSTNNIIDRYYSIYFKS